jgi:hypothetical protein
MAMKMPNNTINLTTEYVDIDMQLKMKNYQIMICAVTMIAYQ